MLPAFVIGLREGLETVVIIGAIVVFARAQGREALLPRIWRVSVAAAAICVGVGFVIRYVEVNLAWRQQEQLETIVGLVAVITVTYMVVWMRRFPKDLRHDSDVAAAAALAKDGGTALVVLAFFAVLREGFEITVFVVATIGLTGATAWLSTGGAFLGVAVALVIGFGVVRGSSHLDVARFFRVTALVLVLSTAGIAMTTVHTANAAGWITFGQKPQFDLSWLAPPGSVVSSFTTGMFGVQPYPVLVEVAVWLAYFVPMTAVVLWPKRAHTGRTAKRRLRWSMSAVLALIVGISVVVVVHIGASSTISRTTSPTTRAIATPKTLFATLDGVTCLSSEQCMAVGDYLPVDKDAAAGDPDGDGQATHTLVETFHGGRWKRLPSPDEGHGGAVLSSVSCPSKADCAAVGYYRASRFPSGARVAPPDYPLVESYRRGHWRIMASPEVAPNSVLVGVSCPSTSACTAVGYTTTSIGSGGWAESFFVEDFDGKAWSVAPVPVPPQASSGLNSVSCPSTSNCMAVGDVAPTGDLTDTRPLLEMLWDGSWTTVPLPSGLSGTGILYSVSCIAVGHCMAVGNAVTGDATGAPLVLALNGSTWKVDSTALARGDDISLTALSCSDDADCVVAGTSLESEQRILAAVNGGNWEALPGPSATDNIEDLTCSVPPRCVVVGSAYVNGFGNTTTMIASVSPDDWKAERSPTL